MGAPDCGWSHLPMDNDSKGQQSRHTLKQRMRGVQEVANSTERRMMGERAANRSGTGKDWGPPCKRVHLTGYCRTITAQSGGTVRTDVKLPWSCTVLEQWMCEPLRGEWWLEKRNLSLPPEPKRPWNFNSPASALECLDYKSMSPRPTDIIFFFSFFFFKVMLGTMSSISYLSHTQ